MTANVVVLSTAGSADEARKLARALVERKVAACVNVVPKIESVYRWKGKIESAREWLLLIKTTQRRYKAVEALIQELHSYDLPECIVLPIEGGSRGYLKWLAGEVK